MTIAAVPALTTEAPDADNDARFNIALQVLKIVTTFTYDIAVLELALEDALDPAEGDSRHHVLEREIRRQAPEAETVSRGSAVVCRVLADAYLLDDYLRIVAVEQHFAFDDEMLASEEDDLSAHLATRADQARERAAAAQVRLIDEMRVCRTCGESFGLHQRRLEDAFDLRKWGISSASPGSWRSCDFSDAEQATCVSMTLARLSEALEGWTQRQGLTVTEQQLADAMRLLEPFHAKGRTTLARDAFATLAAALDWS